MLLLQVTPVKRIGSPNWTLLVESVLWSVVDSLSGVSRCGKEVCMCVSTCVYLHVCVYMRLSARVYLHVCLYV